jgi:hypothetical protein
MSLCLYSSFPIAPSQVHTASHTWTLTFWVDPCNVSPCTECDKRAFAGTSALSYFVSYTANRSDVTSAHILLRRLLVGNTGSPRVREQCRIHMSGKWGEWVCWAYLGYWGSSGGVQNLAQEQLVRETAHQVSKILSPRLGLAANQSAGPL